MSSHSRHQPETPLGEAIARIEEAFIAFLLGTMVLLTFVNVVLRYIFNESLIWGLEVVLVLFAWLVLFGISHAFRITAHLGVDAVTSLMPPRGQRTMGIIAGVLCIIYAALLLKGAWDYYAPFAGLDATSGRWFPTGFEDSRDQAWYETDQIPMLDWLRWLEPLVNQGESYEKLPRFVVYLILPVGCLLMLIRSIQATVGVINGHRDSLIVSHEAEDQVDDLSATHHDEPYYRD
ncbi:TRAP transporter small permease [Tropicimonas isoalkanivorans]|uniref:TRAP transporter small permease protein n=1 Tax=Tropicimonas isoalkanivorans TaxID=441112 RepID=A0A1I1PTY9_9RHOB|nr:TRAP transporter small permease [Tropicimonas isoalkanivorans]SFD13381.1 C4-dicarboxylate transporter, DctQ subunit [Tropicimonas isoalkanivorans]